VNLFDSSALLALVLDETGSDVVEEALAADPTDVAVSAVNWSEVAQKVLAHRRNWPAVRALLIGYDLRVEPVTAADAEGAAQRWSDDPSLSLADRVCLATADRLDATVWTADRGWGTGGRVRQIRGG